MKSNRVSALLFVGAVLLLVAAFSWSKGDGSNAASTTDVVITPQEESTTTALVETTVAGTTSTTSVVEPESAPTSSLASVATTSEPAPTTVETTTTTTIPSWEDLANPARIVIPAINVDTHMEITTVNAKGEFNPSEKGVGWFIEYQPSGQPVGPCELGTVWTMGHSHSTGVLQALVINTGDHYADQGLERSLQLDDIVEITLEDGTSCRYQVVEFGPVTSGMPIDGSPAVAWPKGQFGEVDNHPTYEWGLAAPGEGIMYLSASGGWPMVEMGGSNHRPQLDVVKTSLLDS